MSIPSSDHDSAVHHKTRGQEDPCFNVCIIVTAIILPPFSVFCVKGCGKDFAINLVLTILGLIPGMIHAIYIFIKNPDETFGVSQKELREMEEAMSAETGRVYPVPPPRNAVAQTEKPMLIDQTNPDQVV